VVLKPNEEGFALEYCAEPEPNVIETIGVPSNVLVSLHKPADSKKEKRKGKEAD
jgi:hypothetical protein